MPGQVHVIGAGLAGLSAAVRLAQAGTAVTVHEATRQAGRDKIRAILTEQQLPEYEKMVQEQDAEREKERENRNREHKKSD